MTNSPLAHLAYIEVGSADPQASVDFYTDNFGMRVVDHEDDRYYLRAWGDHYRYSLIVSPAEDACLKTMAWRTKSDADLNAAVAAVEAEGVDGMWSEPAHHRGHAFSFIGPYGHVMTLVWDLEEYVAEPDHASVYPDRPEKRSVHAAAPRFLDHITVAASDVRGFAEWYSRVLGFRMMGFTTLEDSPIHVFGVLTTNEKSHDLGVLLDTSQAAGRIHHYAWWVDQPEDLIRTAEIMTEYGIQIEYGPSIHGIGEQHFLYFREPGSGIRIEINSGGYRNYVPDWRPRTWVPSEGANSFFRNLPVPASMMEAFPAAEGKTSTEQGVPPELAEELRNPWAKTG